MSRLVHCLQTCTAAAAAFAVLGACGLTPLSRGPRVRPHARPDRTEVTIRSLTGAWVAVVATSAGAETVSMSLMQSGNSLAGTLSIGERALASDPGHPAFIGRVGEFTLGFGHSHERVVVTARPSSRADRLSAWIRRIDRPPVAAVFTRP